MDVTPAIVPSFSVSISVLRPSTAAHHGLQHLGEELLHQPPALLLQPLPDGHQPRSLPRLGLFRPQQPAEPRGLRGPGPERARDGAGEQRARQQRQRQGGHAEPEQPSGQLPG